MKLPTNLFFHLIIRVEIQEDLEIIQRNKTDNNKIGLTNSFFVIKEKYLFKNIGKYNKKETKYKN